MVSAVSAPSEDFLKMWLNIVIEGATGVFLIRRVNVENTSPKDLESNAERIMWKRPEIHYREKLDLHNCR